MCISLALAPHVVTLSVCQMALTVKYLDSSFDKTSIYFRMLHNKILYNICILPIEDANLVENIKINFRSLINGQYTSLLLIKRRACLVSCDVKCRKRLSDARWPQLLCRNNWLHFALPAVYTNFSFKNCSIHFSLCVFITKLSYFPLISVFCIRFCELPLCARFS